MNPFVYGTVVRGNNFFDRKKEAEHIIKTLKGGNNMVLYASRRFGKTSLIFHVIEEMEKENFICIYFDFMPIYSVESFVRLYTKAISAKQSNIRKFAKSFSSLIKNIRPVISFNDSGEQEFSIDFANTTIDETVIADLFDITEIIAGKNKRVIVFFDEFQEVEKLNRVNFENLLRSKIQKQSKTNYLFLGSKTHILNELFNNKKKAFYNSASQMTLDTLPREDTITYLMRNFGAQHISITNEMAHYLISVAGDIPHYIQLLASEIWQYMINNKALVTTKIIDFCAQRVLFLNSDYYMELFDRQSQGRKQLLQALCANGKNIYSSGYIHTNRLTSVATVQRAAKQLIEDGTIEKMKDTYFIADPFFKLFVENITQGKLYTGE
jgi:AAA+ ATPase superfamily predicted ATPase